MEHRVIYSSPLPYDSEIEYLESSGTQYIKTNILLKNIVSIETNCSFTVANTAQAEGCTAGGHYLFFGTNTQNKFYTGVGPIITTTTVVNNGQFHDFTIEDGSFYIDRNLININGIWPSLSEYRFYIFACNGIIGQEGNAGYFVCEKKKNIKIYGENRKLLFDGIPVRVGQVGYMYDKVSCRLFGNSGSGNFILGQDINNNNISRCILFNNNQRYVLA